MSTFDIGDVLAELEDLRAKLAAELATSSGRLRELERVAAEKNAEWKRAENAEAQRDAAVAKLDASERAGAAMRRVLSVWSTLYRLGYTQKTCEGVGLGLEHVRGGAPEVQRAVLVMVDAALAPDAGRAYVPRAAVEAIWNHVNTRRASVDEIEAMLRAALSGEGE